MRDPLPILHLDCDEILSDFKKKFLGTIQQVTGKPVDTSLITQWDYMDVVLAGQPAWVKGAVFAKIRERGWCRDLEPMPGAIEGMKVVKQYADVHIVTSPWHTPYWCSERYEWLMDIFYIQSRNVSHIKRKELVGMEGDLFVDDKPETIAAWNARHGAGAYVWDTPHTRTELPELPRVHGWEELIEFVKRRHGGSV
jgi:5'(3')-deoxyribonucleotidase